jgi:hypothetical protein
MSYAPALAPTLGDEKMQMIDSTGVLDAFSL